MKLIKQGSRVVVCTIKTSLLERSKTRRKDTVVKNHSKTSIFLQFCGQNYLSFQAKNSTLKYEN